VWWRRVLVRFDMDETERCPVFGCKNAFGFEHRPHVGTACSLGTSSYSAAMSHCLNMYE
jgi:hypothetical protein